MLNRPPHDDGAREGWALEAMKPTSVGGLRCGHRLTDPRLNLGIFYRIPLGVDGQPTINKSDNSERTMRY